MERPGPSYWLTRLVFLRALGFIYLVAFLSLSQQLRGLIGAQGLLPASLYLRHVEQELGSGWPSLAGLPTLFWASTSDAFMQAMSWMGLGMALAVVGGFANSVLLAALWALYLSFVHIGQIFYGYGWEILLLETGFLAIFLCPPLRIGLLPRRTPPPAAVIWLLRWVLFRVMLGAGLIKLRGDPCWRDLTCLMFHYETQPLPNPLSWALHQMPPWFHQMGALWNHFVELVVPFGLLGPRRVRTVAGLLQAAFQITLILSGNLSWLNWLTLALCIACFDDRALSRLFPPGLRARVAELGELRPGRARKVVTWTLVGGVVLLSVNPVANMLSGNQIMNTSFDRFHLVNTYGAFGSVGRERDEIVLQGTADEEVGDGSHWVDYEFPCKPGDVNRRPCVIAPYQVRLDWQIWFAAMSDSRSHPWLVHLAFKLLQGDEQALGLMASNPFPNGPPHAIRAELYRYEFTRRGENGWWKRRRIEPWLPPLTLEDPTLGAFLRRHGWLE